MKMKKWSSQWTQFMQLRKEAWKKFININFYVVNGAIGFPNNYSRYIDL